MSEAAVPPSGRFLPGDRVRIMGGLFAGEIGHVLSPAEARTLWQRSGGEAPPSKVPAWCVAVALTVFERLVPVWFESNQLERDAAMPP